MKNLAIAFIERELIKTTVPKAKELRSFVEPLITMAKDDSVANRRRAFNKLRLDSAVNKLFTEIAVKSKDRPGGYLRIIKAGFRPGDKADMAYVEPLITMAKDDSVANRRRAFNKLRLDSAVNKLFTEIAVKSKDRPGGYLRIIKAGFRPGDKADMAYVEWVDRDLDGSTEIAEPELKEGSSAA